MRRTPSTARCTFVRSTMRPSFAVNSRVREVLVLTVSFTVHFARPVTSGEVRAIGRFLHGSSRVFLADAELVDTAGQLLGRGSGVFTRSAIALEPRIGYA
jgi:acyl-coenzyme A thioesterase PaaI-like protein